jgi:hypothetical protein
MTFRKLLAIALIFCCAAVAWFTLGISVVSRTGKMDRALATDVAGLWGGRHAQMAPLVWYETTRAVAAEETVAEVPTEPGSARRQVVRRHPVQVASSRLQADLHLDHRRKGLLWFDTYTVDFSAHYRLHMPAEVSGPLHLRFTFPAEGALYDGFRFLVDGRSIALTEDFSRGVHAELDAVPGSESSVEIAYRSRGVDSWEYRFVEAGVAQVQDFELLLTADCDDIDFPGGSLSPSSKNRLGDGWQLGWRFDNLVSGQSIAVDLPNRANPGPLAARIIFFAPVSLLFFLTVAVILGMTRQENLHPMHYFFLSAAFFAFHLLLAYLVDHLDIHLSFAIAAAVSLFLVISYLAQVCGVRRALLQAGLAQLIFLLLFSYAFFFEGYTGLTVTVGAVLTLFILMQLTGRVDWDRIFGVESVPAGVDASA